MIPQPTLNGGLLFSCGSRPAAAVRSHDSAAGKQGSGRVFPSAAGLASAVSIPPSISGLRCRGRRSGAVPAHPTPLPLSRRSAPRSLVLPLPPAGAPLCGGLPGPVSEARSRNFLRRSAPSSPVSPVTSYCASGGLYSPSPPPAFPGFLLPRPVVRVFTLLLPRIPVSGRHHLPH